MILGQILKKKKLGLCYFADDDFDGGAGGSDDLNLGNTDNQGSDNLGSSEFSIPDEYATRGWAKTFEGKSGDELKAEIFKSYDNAQSMTGKKASELLTSVKLADLENYEDVKKALLPQLAPQYNVPEDIKDYNLSDVFKDDNGNLTTQLDENITNHFANAFKGHGLNVSQAQGVIKTYLDFEKQTFDKLTDTKALDKSLDAMFNNDNAAKDKCSSLLKEYLSNDDQQFLQNTAPNKYIEILYKVAKGFSDNYDYKEGTSAGARGSAIKMSQAEKDQAYDKYYKELKELDSRPHTAEEKQEIINKIVALNK